MRAVIDLDRLHAILRAEIIFQHIRLGKRHLPAAHVNPQPPGKVM